MKEEIEKHIIDGTIVNYIEDKNDTITALWISLICAILFSIVVCNLPTKEVVKVVIETNK